MLQYQTITYSVSLKYTHFVINAFIVQWYDLICNHPINTVDNEYHPSIQRLEFSQNLSKKNMTVFLLRKNFFFKFYNLKYRNLTVKMFYISNYMSGGPSNLLFYKSNIVRMVYVICIIL